MDITKSHWVTDENRVRLNMPIAKVDEERRLVSGFATLDNIDSQKDVVLAEASARAFARARGNIREMHQPIAAGRLVDFREDEFIKDGQVYRGIYVTAYVSKGAQNTWEKVLDGTLTGFSIGGEIIESESQWVKDANSSVRFIKDYDLTELSLVDNPANPLANVFSIQKSAEGSVIKGIMAETVIENVFWCNADSVARVVKDESADCSFCGKTMENIGWVESGDDRTEKVKQIVDDHLRLDKTTEIGEGGVDVSKTVEKTATAEEEVVQADAPTETPEENSEVETEEAAKVDEVEEPDFTKMFDDLKKAVSDSLAENREELTKAVDEKVSELERAVNEKTSELSKTVGELSEKFKSVTDSSEEVTKRLESLEESTAIKKSGDVQTEPEKKEIKKDKGWNGAFLSVHDLKR